MLLILFQFIALGNCSCTWEKIEANLEEKEKRYIIALLEEKENQINLCALDDL